VNQKGQSNTKYGTPKHWNFLLFHLELCHPILPYTLDCHHPIHKPIHTNILLAVMFPRNKVFQTILFDASSGVNEPLIAAGDAEEEDHRLQDKATLVRFKFSCLLLGVLVGFLSQFSTLGGIFRVMSIGGEHVVTQVNDGYVRY
jgi:hypothetical protein